MERKKEYTKICVVCGNEFTSTRSDAKCCGNICRSYLSRKKKIPIKKYIEKQIKDKRNLLFPEWSENAQIEIQSASEDLQVITITDGNKKFKITTKIEDMSNEKRF